MAECGRLLSAYPGKLGSRVRIPLPPHAELVNISPIKEYNFKQDYGNASVLYLDYRLSDE